MVSKRPTSASHYFLVLAILPLVGSLAGGSLDLILLLFAVLGLFVRSPGARRVWVVLAVCAINPMFTLPLNAQEEEVSLTVQPTVAEEEAPHALETGQAHLSSVVADGGEGPSLEGGADLGSPSARQTITLSGLTTDLFTGSASARIPIELPPGRQGMTPNLDLLYRMGADNGPLGVGWDLAGEAIERDRRFGIRFDLEAYVFIQGNSRLELVQVTENQFRARIEQAFLRFERISDPRGTWWRVTDRMGTVHTLGREPSARVADSSDPERVFRWNLEHVADTSGNFYRFTYTAPQEGWVYLSGLEYTGFGGPQQPKLQPVQAVRFHWQDRPDAPVLYSTGFRVRIAKRLAAIEVLSAGAPTRSYRLAYELSGNSQRSLLVRVELFDRRALVAADGSVSGGESMPPRTIAWYAEGATMGGGQVHEIGSAALDGGYETGRMWADINGDSRADYCRRVGNVNLVSSFVRCATSTGSGFGAEVTSGVLDWGHDAGRAWVDANGDGLADYCRVVGNPGELRVRCTISTGNGFGAELTSDILDGGLETGRAWTDINGDGRADYCRRVGNVNLVSSFVRCVTSTGSGFGAEITSGVLDWGQDAGRAWVDTNGDSRADYCRVVGNPGELRVRCMFSTGNGFGPEFTSQILDAGYDSGRSWVDVNGDRNADYCRLVGNVNRESSFVRCTLSTGSGFAEEFTSGVLDWGDGDRSWVDFNGDDRADFCRLVNDAGVRARCTPSFGDRFGDDRLQSEPLERGDSAGRAWTDNDGDGRPDFCRLIRDAGGARAQCLEAIDPVASPPQDLLRSLANGFGGSASLAYTSSSTFENRLLPFVIQTVGRMTLSDGVGGSTSIDYRYAGGFYHFGRREFRGFAQAVEVGPQEADGEQLVRRTSFHQGDAADGRVENLAATEGALVGRPFRTEDRGGNDTLFSVLAVSYREDSEAPFFSPPIQIDQLRFDPPLAPGTTSPPTGVGHQAIVRVEYDDYGNTVKREVAHGPAGRTVSDRVVVNEYSINLDRWILGLPSRSASFQGGDPPQKLEEAFYTYDGTAEGDCAATPVEGIPSRGLLTRVRRWSSDPALPDPEMRMGYDAQGNLTCTRDPNGNQWEFRFDPTQTYLIEAVNPLGHRTSTHYSGVAGEPLGHGLFGQIRRIVDPNHNKTGLSYDTFGRLIEVRLPDGGLLARSFIGVGSPPAQRVEVRDAVGLVYRSYFDGLLRVHLEQSSGPDGKVIETAYRFSPRGFLEKQSLPYFAGIDTPRWTEFGRDSLGRLARVAFPDGTRRLLCRRDLTTWILDESGHLLGHVTDSLGRLIEVQEYLAARQDCTTTETPDARTRFEFNALDELTRIIDVAGNVTEITFDSLRRKRSLSDPDLGLQTFDYDANGNLLQKTDAIGSPISFTYDSLNRLTRKEYGKPEGSGKDDVIYGYDRPWRNGIGRLGSVRSRQTSSQYLYDPLGRRIRSYHKIARKEFSTQVYYDGIGRIRSFTYPDGEQLWYLYDASLLAEISDVRGVYARFGLYNAAGQPGSVRFGNGVTTRYTYSPERLRLLSIRTEDSSGRLLFGQDLNYTPDGNIASIEDPLHGTERFQYDGLDRLSVADGPDGTVTLAYDQIGNLLSQSGVGIYKYSPSGTGSRGPHAVRQVGNSVFSYDGNGNMIKGGGRRIRYDVEGLPIRIDRKRSNEARAATVEMEWDGDGGLTERSVYIGRFWPPTSFLRRLLRLPSERSVRVQGLYECGRQGCTKYMFAGRRLIAERRERDGFTLFYHADALGSTRTTTGADGGEHQSFSYLPFGESRAPSQSGEGVRFAFTGQPLEAAVGLYLLGRRLYDPRLGRFLSPDPLAPDLERPQTLNRYSYVHNNPVNFVDPSGHREVPIDHDPDNPGGGDGSDGAGTGDGGGGADEGPRGRGDFCCEIGDQPELPGPEPRDRHDSDIRDPGPARGESSEPKEPREPHERPDRPDRSDRPDRPDRSDRSDRDSSGRRDFAERQETPSFSGPEYISVKFQAGISTGWGPVSIGVNTGGSASLSLQVTPFGVIGVDSDGFVSGGVSTPMGSILGLEVTHTFNSPNIFNVSVDLNAGPASVGVEITEGRDLLLEYGVFQQHIINWVLSGGTYSTE